MQIESSRHSSTSQPRVASSFTRTSHPDDSGSNDWRPGRMPRLKPPAKKLDAFLRAQQERLLELRDALVSSMNGVARETRLEKADSSAFATHNGDAGSDACDRDLVLCLLSQ